MDSGGVLAPNPNSVLTVPLALSRLLRNDASASTLPPTAARSAGEMQPRGTQELLRASRNQIARGFSCNSLGDSETGAEGQDERHNE